MIVLTIPSFQYKQETVLSGIHIALEPGKTYGLIGLNGAGKTTFFKLVAGLLKNSECSFEVDGKKLSRKNISYLDTDLFFYPKLTAREFLSVFETSSERYNEEKLAEVFRLPLDDLIEEFSTGMKKKLLILSQLKQDKELYILDEPFNGLDLETNKIIEVIITSLNKRGKTVLLSSHILEPLLNTCEHIYHLKDGVIHASYSDQEFHKIEEHLFGDYKRLVTEYLTEFL